MPNLQYAKARLDFESFLSWLEGQPNLLGGFLFGSVARGDGDFRSDLDIALVVTEHLEMESFSAALANFFGKNLFYLHYFKKKKTVVVFLENHQKIDLLISSNPDDLLQNFCGSFIPLSEIPAIVLFDKRGDLSDFLVQNHQSPFSLEVKKRTEELIHSFLYEFEACSRFHAKSDSYRFYFNYNLALHKAVQLKYLAKGNQFGLYLPRNFTYKSLENDEQEVFSLLSGTIDLKYGNSKKRKLLNFFYKTIEVLRYGKLPFVKAFCESIFSRDYYWNFRDFAEHSTLLQHGKVFRSASLSLYENLSEVERLLTKNKIVDVVDLRAAREVEEYPYPQGFLSKINYTHVPFDPWDQPEWFVRDHHFGDNRSIAYRFFLKGCQASFKKIMETIAESEEAVLVHCFAGKDRTGLVIGALQLLLGESKINVLADYMASGGDADEQYFRLLFTEIENMGGIMPYFAYQGVDQQTVLRLREKLADT